MDTKPSLKDRPPEEIRQHIVETRTALTEKLEQFEEAVKGTVDNARETVEETIQNVKETIDETVASVKQTFDLEYQVRKRPWLMLSGAAVAGYAISRCVRPDHSRTTPKYDSLAAGMTAAAVARDIGNGYTQREVPSIDAASPPLNPDGTPEPRGSLTRVKNEFQDELDQLQGIAIGALMGLVRDGVKEALPISVSAKVADVIDSVTSKLGGEPIPGTVASSATCT